MLRESQISGKNVYSARLQMKQHLSQAQSRHLHDYFANVEEVCTPYKKLNKNNTSKNNNNNNNNNVNINANNSYNYNYNNNN